MKEEIEIKNSKSILLPNGEIWDYQRNFTFITKWFGIQTRKKTVTHNISYEKATLAERPIGLRQISLRDEETKDKNRKQD